MEEPEDRLRLLAARYPSWGDGAALRRAQTLARDITTDSATLFDSAALAAGGEAGPAASIHDLHWSDHALAAVVRDHLNDGRTIGGLSLPPGFQAVLPENVNPGTLALLVVGPDGDQLRDVSVRVSQRVRFLHGVLADLGRQDLDDLRQLGRDDDEPSFEDDLVPDVADLLDETVENLADESVFDLGSVGLVQMARLTNRMALNLVQGRRPTEGVDWSSEAFSFLVNQVATGVGDLASLAVGPVGPVAGFGTRVAVRRATHRHGSALALEVATARVRAAVADRTV